jgi:hypothetical protein
VGGDGFRRVKMDELRSRNNCVSESILNAEKWVELTGRPARIAVSKIDKEKDIDHSQAMGQEADGTWTYLTAHKNDGVLRRWTKHFDAEPYRYSTANSVVKEKAHDGNDKSKI